MSLTAKITPWDTSIPRSLALVKYIQAAIDLAIETYRDHPRGLVHLVIPQAEYEMRFANADGTPVTIPELISEPDELPANATAVDIANSNRRHKKFDTQMAAKAHMENQIEQNYPSDIRQSIEINFSLNHLTIIEQFQELKRLNPVSDADLKWLKSSISAPFPVDGNIAAFTGIQLSHVAHLKRLGQPLAPIDAIKYMFKAHQSTYEDKEDYKSFLTMYQAKFTLI